MVKRSRVQSQDAPRRRICRVIVDPDSAFHAHTRSTNLLAPEVASRLAFGLQLILDDDLRRDAGVIGADLPKRVVAEHAVVADQDVHQRLLERVPHVQRAGDIGRRKLDAERRRRPASSTA